MTITIQNVAKTAGVSRSTANMILTGKDERYAAKTRDRVKQAAAELGYRPNIAARSLRQQRSYLVGAIFNQLNNSYTNDYLFGLQNRAIQHDCTPAVLVTDSSQAELEALHQLADRRVDGLIVNPAPTDGEASPVVDEIHRLRESGLPIVEVFGTLCAPKVPSVRTDAYRAGYLAAKQAVDLGCERVMIVMRDDTTLEIERNSKNWFMVDLHRGATDALIEAGQEPRYAVYSVKPDWDLLETSRSIIADHQPDAVITLSDALTPYFAYLTNNEPQLVAENFVLCALEHSLGPLAYRFNKAIIKLSIREAVEQAVDVLFEMIDGSELVRTDITLSPTVQWVEPLTMN